MYDSLGSSWNVCNILWLKFPNGRVKEDPFYNFTQKQLCSQQPISVHVSLNDNELLLTQPLTSVFVYLLMRYHQKQN